MIFFYTNNPIEIDEEILSKKRMPFVRRSLGAESFVYGETTIEMSRKTMKKLSPDYPSTDSLYLGYSIDDPEFEKSITE